MRQVSSGPGIEPATAVSRTEGLQAWGALPSTPPEHAPSLSNFGLFCQVVIDAGALSGQRGFLGCMRSLKINGIFFDLEERAKVTPGVKPGCQGHCSTYKMHCRNGGKCVEQYNGYSCDCSLSAYDGPFCTDDVGGYFEAGTMVRYDFLLDHGGLLLGDPRSFSNLAFLGETNLTQEELVFSFSTYSAPSILVYISSRTQDYMAVVLRHNGSLQVRYSLGGLVEPYTIDIDHRNMANGQPHSVNITRNLREIRLQVGALILLVADGQEAEYRELVDRFVSWCGNNHLILNVNKAKEMTVDFRKNRVR
ncbi:hypothetical protein CCH79_00017333 [Gambusia affinis]|uniref:EGF-like domain-containing protein n=1 Tax=Gambusia affinis TaxID=33528 RepID=A0A315W4S8_GAMAF|nr:hypothetical protein CCH79_00017333 [Gambusia affinis]